MKCTTPGKFDPEIFLTFHGQTLSLKAWAKKIDIAYTTLFQRYKRQWPVDRLLTQRPVKFGPEFAPERFWSKVDKTPGQGPKGECWEWQTSCSEDGYGNFTIGRNKTRAHRMGYLLQHGPIPPRMQVLHRCDNPPCVRGEHLFLGTNADNVADKMSKGRHRTVCGDQHHMRRRPELIKRGENSPRTQLKWAQVVEMRRLYETKEANQYQIARMFSTTQSTVSRIVRYEGWIAAS